MKKAFGATLTEGGRCSREEFWRELEALPPPFAQDAARVTRWMERTLGARGVAYARRAVEPAGGDLYLVAARTPDVFVQFDADLEYVIVGDAAGQGEAGDWLEDRAAEALRWLEDALNAGDAT